MDKLRQNRFVAVASCLTLATMLLCVPFVAAQETQSRRAVLTPDPTEVPQFTIQVDAFEALTDAVEFGYELPFDEDTLGLAKFRQGTAVRYILALGTFYTYGEASGVMREMCPQAGLLNCRVRYLGDLESISAQGSEQHAPVQNAPVVTEKNDLPLEQSEPEYFEAMLDAEDKALQVAAPVASAEAPSVTLIETPAKKVAAYDGDFVYTVQVAAMYSQMDARQIAKQIPSDMGIAEIYPLIGGRGNLVHSVTVGRFAYKDNAQEFADKLCEQVGQRGCWVKPLTMIEQELEIVQQRGDALPQTTAAPAQTVSPVAAPTESASSSEDGRLVYTVQVAAMYDENDAKSVANDIPSRFGERDVVPIRSVNGDVVYSVTLGRFAYKSEGQRVADDICERLNLSGCWVKPVALIEQARVEEW